MIEKYLNKEELDLYNHLKKKRALKKVILKKREELKKLQDEYSKLSDTEYWKRLWITKQAVNTRACILQNKIKRLKNS